jgi:hypothetical protein
MWQIGFSFFIFQVCIFYNLFFSKVGEWAKHTHPDSWSTTPNQPNRTVSAEVGSKQNKTKKGTSFVFFVCFSFHLQVQSSFDSFLLQI